jgi:hypothetical protein
MTIERLPQSESAHFISTKEVSPADNTLVYHARNFATLAPIAPGTA